MLGIVFAPVGADLDSSSQKETVRAENTEGEGSNPHSIPDLAFEIGG
jgi:hypothetical protein